MIAAFLAVATWKMALYVAVLLSLVWKITNQINQIALLKADLAFAHDSINRFKQMQQDGFDCQKRLREALASSENRVNAAMIAIRSMRPPDDAVGAVEWLNSIQAKG